MEKTEALRRIKELRDQINDHPDPAGAEWNVNGVLYRLDQAADIIEFGHRVQDQGNSG